MKKSEEKKTKKEKPKNSINSLGVKKKASLGKRNRQRGNEYERRIAKELNDIGFQVVTSRSESKRADDNKIDLIDLSNKLPVQLQLKRVTSTPQYFKIREESTVPNRNFALLWNKQKNVNGRFMSEGEVVLIDKEMFYQLIAPYAQSSN